MKTSIQTWKEALWGNSSGSVGPLRPLNSTHTSLSSNTCLARYVLEKQHGSSNVDRTVNQNFQSSACIINEPLTLEKITAYQCFRILFSTWNVGEIIFALLTIWGCCEAQMKLPWKILCMIAIIPMRYVLIPRVETETRSQMDIKMCKGPTVPIKTFWLLGTARCWGIFTNSQPQACQAPANHRHVKHLSEVGALIPAPTA